MQISVGSSATKFQVHRDLLCSQSQYFAKLYSGPWVDGKGDHDLPEDNDVAFSMIVHWLYTGKFSFTPVVEAQDMAYLQLYVLADKLLFNKMESAIFKCICEASSKKWYAINAAEVTYIYENTSPDTRLRRYAANLIAFCINQQPENTFEQFRGCIEKIPDFAFDLCQAMKNAMKSAVSWGPSPPDPRSTQTTHPRNDQTTPWASREW